MDDETNWQRQLLVGLGVLVAVGALIGGIVALVSIKAADYAGIGSSSDDDTSTSRPREPSDDAPSITDEPTDPGSTATEPQTPSQPSTKPPSTGITLVATPKAVPTYGRINLRGTYTGGAGTTLQVQRMESGRWVDFPTSATVNGGTFATYVETGRPGPNKFRVTAVGESRSSNSVTVRVS